MRAVVFVVALAGCGRFGFGESDPSDHDDAASDAIDPDATPQFCDDRVVTTLPIGPTDAIALRAVALSTGYAVATELVNQSIPLLEIDDTGALVGMHAPFATGYAPLFGMSRHGARPVVFLATGGVGYMKHVNPGWDDYTTGSDGDPVMIDPGFAEIDTSSGFSSRIRSGVFEVGLVDESDFNTITVSDYSPTTVASASLVPIPTGARVVVEKAGGVCETFIIRRNNTMTSLHAFAPCYAPKVAALDETSGAIVHRTAATGPYAVHLIPAVASDAGTTLPLAGATIARVASRVDGAYWVGHGSGSYRALLRITPGGATSESRENVAAYNFDLTARDAFWIERADVHVSTPCLR